MLSELGPIQSSTAPLVRVIGHVTRDVIITAEGKSERWGGAAGYTAKLLIELGYRVQLVTACQTPEAVTKDLGPQNLEVTGITGHDLTTFELDYRSEHRRVRLLHRAPQLSTLPQLSRPWLTFVVPVAGEITPQTAVQSRGPYVLGLQGFMRQFDADGMAKAVGDDHLRSTIEVLAGDISGGPLAMACSQEDHPAAEEALATFSRARTVRALTTGPQGATVWACGETHQVKAPPAEEHNATGAGDIFLTCLGLALTQGLPVVKAAELACDGAARSVEGPGLGNILGDADLTAVLRP